ncbi:hypothetical protein EYF80_013594 [Liparis tanakae]|uniref:Uncharacterized protein n=1 Tax=Liparis tanakae TaxID=230148 RepID=A0A4Z2IG16_9TELE|nr:hypothetical protein EYF80_013594 [Liparis tanakae]
MFAVIHAAPFLFALSALLSARDVSSSDEARPALYMSAPKMSVDTGKLFLEDKKRLLNFIL